MLNYTRNMVQINPIYRAYIDEYYLCKHNISRYLFIQVTILSINYPTETTGTSRRSPCCYVTFVWRSFKDDNIPNNIFHSRLRTFRYDHVFSHSICNIHHETSPCDEEPLTLHFYIVKLGFTRIHIFFLFLL